MAESEVHMTAAEVRERCESFSKWANKRYAASAPRAIGAQLDKILEGLKRLIKR